MLEHTQHCSITSPAPVLAKARIPFRSLLFVPGDSERKLAKAQDSAADALILDLEDSVAPSRTAIARGLVLDYLTANGDRSRRQLWVRINPLSTSAALLDLCAIAGKPDGIILPKVDSAADVTKLSYMLDALEARDGLSAGQIDIIPVSTETPTALFTLGSYAGCTHRLAGMTWGAEDIAAALGASTNRRPDGEYDEVYQLARSLCLAGAVAAGVQPIDTIWADFSDLAGLERDSRCGRQRGFTGKMAIHPGQVDTINDAFTPNEQELAWSRRVVETFESNPGLGTVGLDGKMLDMPHYKQAQRVLALARRASPI
ncbi:MAG: citrate lyase subunit beta / citryl-CoA lyase [Gammaproteobacteria bacterium]|jgi:citrate lyase subunit beta/citryl-CoA lyase|nr:citrate lyase subunit beta / citryl-CoA lyase [Gammaproteobacteria bacterium]